VNIHFRIHYFFLDRVNSASKGMPNSCSDLQQLGHSFNGFYSVIKSQPNGQGAKIETVYCDFQSPEDSKGKHTQSKFF